MKHRNCDADDLPHREWKCPHCNAVNSMLDAECQFCDYQEINPTGGNQMKQTKQDKAIDKRIEMAYYKGCAGMAVDVMDIGKIFDYGHGCVAAGFDDMELQDKIYHFVLDLNSSRGKLIGAKNV